MMIKNKYLRCLNNRQLYLFILGLSLSVGDIKLILATSIFAGTMLFTYQVKYLPWQNYHRYFTKFLTNQNKQLIFSVATAGTLAIASYVIFNIWTEIDNKWLALGIIWQTIFSLVGMGFMSYKLWGKKKKKNQLYLSPLDKLISQLDHSTPLERLWSINQIMELWETNQLTDCQINQIKEYFILLKNIENEPIIINKLEKSLAKIDSLLIKNFNPSAKFNNNVIKKTPLMELITLEDRHY